MGNEKLDKQEIGKRLGLVIKELQSRIKKGTIRDIVEAQELLLIELQDFKSKIRGIVSEGDLEKFLSSSEKKGPIVEIIKSISIKSETVVSSPVSVQTYLNRLEGRGDFSRIVTEGFNSSANNIILKRKVDAARRKKEAEVVKTERKLAGEIKSNRGYTLHSLLEMSENKTIQAAEREKLNKLLMYLSDTPEGKQFKSLFIKLQEIKANKLAYRGIVNNSSILEIDKESYLEKIKQLELEEEDIKTQLGRISEEFEKNVGFSKEESKVRKIIERRKEIKTGIDLLKGSSTKPDSLIIKELLFKYKLIDKIKEIENYGRVEIIDREELVKQLKGIFNTNTRPVEVGSGNKFLDELIVDIFGEGGLGEENKKGKYTNKQVIGKLINLLEKYDVKKIDRGIISSEYNKRVEIINKLREGIFSTVFVFRDTKRKDINPSETISLLNNLLESIGGIDKKGIELANIISEFGIEAPKMTPKDLLDAISGKIESTAIVYEEAKNELEFIRERGRSSVKNSIDEIDVRKRIFNYTEEEAGTARLNNRQIIELVQENYSGYQTYQEAIESYPKLYFKDPKKSSVIITKTGKSFYEHYGVMFDEERKEYYKIIDGKRKYFVESIDADGNKVMALLQSDSISEGDLSKNVSSSGKKFFNIYEAQSQEEELRSKLVLTAYGKNRREDTEKMANVISKNIDIAKEILEGLSKSGKEKSITIDSNIARIIGLKVPDGASKQVIVDIFTLNTNLINFALDNKDFGRIKSESLYTYKEGISEERQIRSVRLNLLYELRKKMREFGVIRHEISQEQKELDLIKSVFQEEYKIETGREGLESTPSTPEESRERRLRIEQPEDDRVLHDFLSGREQREIELDELNDEKIKAKLESGIGLSKSEQTINELIGESIEELRYNKSDSEEKIEEEEIKRQERIKKEAERKRKLIERIKKAAVSMEENNTAILPPGSIVGVFWLEEDIRKDSIRTRYSSINPAGKDGVGGWIFNLQFREDEENPIPRDERGRIIPGELFESTKRLSELSEEREPEWYGLLEQELTKISEIKYGQEELKNIPVKILDKSSNAVLFQGTAYDYLNKLLVGNNIYQEKNSNARYNRDLANLVNTMYRRKGGHEEFHDIYSNLSLSLMQVIGEMMSSGNGIMYLDGDKEINKLFNAEFADRVIGETLGEMNSSKHRIKMFDAANSFFEKLFNKLNDGRFRSEKAIYNEMYRLITRGISKDKREDLGIYARFVDSGGISLFEEWMTSRGQSIEATKFKYAKYGGNDEQRALGMESLDKTYKQQIDQEALELGEERMEFNEIEMGSGIYQDEIEGQIEDKLSIDFKQERGLEQGLIDEGIANEQVLSQFVEEKFSEYNKLVRARNSLLELIGQGDKSGLYKGETKIIREKEVEDESKRRYLIVEKSEDGKKGKVVGRYVLEPKTENRIIYAQKVPSKTAKGKKKGLITNKYPAEKFQVEVERKYKKQAEQIEIISGLESDYLELLDFFGLRKEVDYTEKNEMIKRISSSYESVNQKAIYKNILEATLSQRESIYSGFSLSGSSDEVQKLLIEIEDAMKVSRSITNDAINDLISESIVDEKSILSDKERFIAESKIEIFGRETSRFKEEIQLINRLLESKKKLESLEEKSALIRDIIGRKVDSFLDSSGTRDKIFSIASQAIDKKINEDKGLLEFIISQAPKDSSKSVKNKLVKAYKKREIDKYMQNEKAKIIDKIKNTRFNSKLLDGTFTDFSIGKEIVINKEDIKNIYQESDREFGGSISLSEEQVVRDSREERKKINRLIKIIGEKSSKSNQKRTDEVSSLEEEIIEIKKGIRKDRKGVEKIKAQEEINKDMESAFFEVVYQLEEKTAGLSPKEKLEESIRAINEFLHSNNIKSGRGIDEQGFLLSIIDSAKEWARNGDILDNNVIGSFFSAFERNDAVSKLYGEDLEKFMKGYIFNKLNDAVESGIFMDGSKGSTKEIIDLITNLLQKGIVNVTAEDSISGQKMEVNIDKNTGRLMFYHRPTNRAYLLENYPGEIIESSYVPGEDFQSRTLISRSLEDNRGTGILIDSSIKDGYLPIQKETTFSVRGVTRGTGQKEYLDSSIVGTMQALDEIMQGAQSVVVDIETTGLLSSKELKDNNMLIPLEAHIRNRNNSEQSYSVFIDLLGLLDKRNARYSLIEKASGKSIGEYTTMPLIDAENNKIITETRVLNNKGIYQNIKLELPGEEYEIKTSYPRLIDSMFDKAEEEMKILYNPEFTKDSYLKTETREEVSKAISSDFIQLLLNIGKYAKSEDLNEEEKVVRQFVMSKGKDVEVLPISFEDFDKFRRGLLSYGKRGVTGYEEMIKREEAAGTGIVVSSPEQFAKEVFRAMEDKVVVGQNFADADLGFLKYFAGKGEGIVKNIKLVEMIMLSRIISSYDKKEISEGIRGHSLDAQVERMTKDIGEDALSAETKGFRQGGAHLGQIDTAATSDVLDWVLGSGKLNEHLAATKEKIRVGSYMVGISSVGGNKTEQDMFKILNYEENDGIFKLTMEQLAENSPTITNEYTSVDQMLQSISEKYKVFDANPDGSVPEEATKLAISVREDRVLRSISESMLSYDSMVREIYNSNNINAKRNLVKEFFVKRIDFMNLKGQLEELEKINPTEITEEQQQRMSAIEQEMNQIMDSLRNDTGRVLVRKADYQIRMGQEIENPLRETTKEERFYAQDYFGKFNPNAEPGKASVTEINRDARAQFGFLSLLENVKDTLSNYAMTSEIDGERVVNIGISEGESRELIKQFNEKIRQRAAAAGVERRKISPPGFINFGEFNFKEESLFGGFDSAYYSEGMESKINPGAGDLGRFRFDMTELNGKDITITANTVAQALQSMGEQQGKIIEALPEEQVNAYVKAVMAFNETEGNIVIGEENIKRDLGYSILFEQLKNNNENIRGMDKVNPQELAIALVKGLKSGSFVQGEREDLTDSLMDKLLASGYSEEEISGSIGEVVNEVLGKYVKIIESDEGLISRYNRIAEARSEIFSRGLSVSGINYSVLGKSEELVQQELDDVLKNSPARYGDSEVTKEILDELISLRGMFGKRTDEYIFLNDRIKEEYKNIYDYINKSSIDYTEGRIDIGEVNNYTRMLDILGWGQSNNRYDAEEEKIYISRDGGMEKESYGFAIQRWENTENWVNPYQGRKFSEMKLEEIRNFINSGITSEDEPSRLVYRVAEEYIRRVEDEGIDYSHPNILSDVVDTGYERESFGTPEILKPKSEYVEPDTFIRPLSESNRPESAISAGIRDTSSNIKDLMSTMLDGENTKNVLGISAAILGATFLTAQFTRDDRIQGDRKPGHDNVPNTSGKFEKGMVNGVEKASSRPFTGAAPSGGKTYLTEPGNVGYNVNIRANNPGNVSKDQIGGAIRNNVNNQNANITVRHEDNTGNLSNDWLSQKISELL